MTSYDFWETPFPWYSVTRTPKGWQCPVCGKVHAPWVASCDCHERKAVDAPTDTTKWPSTATGDTNWRPDSTTAE